MSFPFQVIFHEDSAATILGRLTARSGLASGSATGVPGEGRWLQQADITSITCAVFDEDAAGTADTTAIATPTVTISTSVLDTPVTSNEIWTKGGPGYNFLHDLAYTNFPTGGNTYRVEYEVTLADSGATLLHGAYRGPALALYNS